MNLKGDMELSEKKYLRNKILGKRQCLESHAELSRRICAHILSWSVFSGSDRVLSYCPVRGEADIGSLNSRIMSDKELYLPVISATPNGRGTRGNSTDGAAMTAVRCFKREELSPGAYNIPAPLSTNPAAGAGELDLVLVPGVVFDKNGWRIGFGKGFYDRFLRGVSGIKAGICFDMQIVPKSVHEEHDISMDFLITENGILL